MKLSKKLLSSGMSLLFLAGVVAGAAVTFSKKQSKAAETFAATDDGYSVYYSGDLGFETRDSNDTRVVLGDADHGEQAVGAELAKKSEQIFTFKKTRSNYWMGVGGYAVYVSGDTTIRFLYLSHSTSGNYGRNAEVSNLVLKTADGATALTSVTGDGKLFTNYTKAIIRFDVTDPTAVKAHFHVEYNGVEYFTFNGSTLVDTVTYTHKCSGFSSIGNKAMCGYNGTQGGLSIIKFQTYDNERNLDPILSAGATVFKYDNIGNFFFNIDTSEQIFTKTGYLNDHINEYLGYDGNPLQIGDGLIINGHSFKYWIDYVPSTYSYPRNEGTMAFPLNAAPAFSPVAIEHNGSYLAFKIDTTQMPCDSLVITFKAGVFKGYHNGNTFILPHDVTFKSTLNEANLNDVGANIKLTRQPVETVQNYGITNPSDWGEKTSNGGNKYRQYALWTNVPRNASMNQAFFADHYRYMFENILINGKSVNYYNVWARGNSKDFTDLGSQTQNPAYETTHPTGAVNKIYDTAIIASIATDQPNYVIILNIPNQLAEDHGLNIAALSFELRDGSAWFTTDGVVRINCTPEDRYVVEAFVEKEMHMFDYTSEVGYCNDAEHHYYLTAKQAYNALSSEQKEAFQNANCFKPAKARYEAWASANNDANPYDNNNEIVNAKTVTRFEEESSVSAILIITVVTLMSATIVMVLIKKRRHSN